MPIYPYPRPRPIPRPWPPAPPGPIQIELNAFDLMWLAMGGVVRLVGSNVFIRTDTTSTQYGTWLYVAKIAGQLARAVLGQVKDVGNTVISSAAGIVAGPVITDDDLYAARDSGDAAITASACRGMTGL
jgi:hypothetical protein